MKKRILTSLLMLTFAVAIGFAFVPKATQAKSNTWYKSVMKKRAKKAKLKYYALVDINKDGTKELILCTRKDGKIFQGEKAEIWARVNKKNKKIKKVTDGAGDEFRYYKKGKNLVYYYRASGESHLTIYKLKKGALKAGDQLDYYSPNHDPSGNNDTAVYYINKKSVDEKTFNDSFDKYYSSKTKLKFKKVK